MVIYVGGAIIGLRAAGYWRADLASESVFWYVGTGLVFFVEYNASATIRGFRRTLVQALSLTVVLEFLANLSSFGFAVELALVPLLVIVGGTLAVSASPHSNSHHARVADSVSHDRGTRSSGAQRRASSSDLLKRRNGSNSSHSARRCSDCMFPAVRVCTRCIRELRRPTRACRVSYTGRSRAVLLRATQAATHSWDQAAFCSAMRECTLDGDAVTTARTGRGRSSHSSHQGAGAQPARSVHRESRTDRTTRCRRAISGLGVQSLFAARLEACLPAIARDRFSTDDTGRRFEVAHNGRWAIRRIRKDDREALNLVEELERIFDSTAVTEAFGPAGVPGDPLRILELAERLILVYSRMLRWTAAATRRKRRIGSHRSFRCTQRSSTGRTNKSTSTSIVGSSWDVTFHN